MYASFERFQFQMTLAQAKSASHQGDCYEDVRELLKNPRIKNQFKRIPVDSIRDELSGYGAWDSEELADDEMNQVRIVWLAAGNIREENPRK